MMYTEYDTKTRKNILANYLDIVSEIASIEYQKRTWIEGLGPQVSSYDDAMCEFFLSSQPILEDFDAYDIPPNHYNLLSYFYSELNAFIGKFGTGIPEDFIDSIEWKKIVQTAQEILITFNHKNTRMNILDPAAYKEALLQRKKEREMEEPELDSPIKRRPWSYRISLFNSKDLSFF